MNPSYFILSPKKNIINLGESASPLNNFSGYVARCSSKLTAMQNSTGPTKEEDETTVDGSEILHRLG